MCLAAASALGVKQTTRTGKSRASGRLHHPASQHGRARVGGTGREGPGRERERRRTGPPASQHRSQLGPQPCRPVPRTLCWPLPAAMRVVSPQTSAGTGHFRRCSASLFDLITFLLVVLIKWNRKSTARSGALSSSISVLTGRDLLLREWTAQSSQSRPPRALVSGQQASFSPAVAIVNPMFVPPPGA